jgi:hypothetical protein
MKVTSSIVLLLLFLVGCGRGSTEDGDWMVTRDSSGISIVENSLPALPPEVPVTISAAPVVAIGNDDQGEAYQFSGIVYAGLLNNRSVVVADGGSRSLRWYDANGTHLTSAGTLGDGPGEFRQITWAGVMSGDSVVVWDGQAGRVSLFHSGRFVRDYRLLTPEPWVLSSVGGVFSDGSMVTVPTPIPETGIRTGVYRLEVPLWIVSPQGSVNVEVGMFPSPAVEYSPAATPGAVVRRILPFGPTTMVAVGSNRMVVGDNANYELRVFHETGDLERIVRLPGSPRLVTPRDLELELERRLRSGFVGSAALSAIRFSFDA